VKWISRTAAKHVVVILISSGLIVGGLGLGTGLIMYEIAFGEGRRFFKGVRLGMTSEEVVDLVGEPQWVHEGPATEESEYYVDGYARRRRPVTGRVFIYVRGEAICYVYISPEDRVEEVFIGGS
jgi:hypothetical protein